MHKKVENRNFSKKTKKHPLSFHFFCFFGIIIIVLQREGLHVNAGDITLRVPQHSQQQGKAIINCRGEGSE